MAQARISPLDMSTQNIKPMPAPSFTEFLTLDLLLVITEYLLPEDIVSLRKVCINGRASSPSTTDRIADVQVFSMADSITLDLDDGRTHDVRQKSSLPSEFRPGKHVPG